MLLFVFPSLELSPDTLSFGRKMSNFNGFAYSYVAHVVTNGRKNDVAFLKTATIHHGTPFLNARLYVVRT